MRQFKNSVFFKLMFMIIVISLIPLLFLSYRFARLSTSSINYELVSSYQQIEEQYSSSVNRRLERYYDILGQISIRITSYNVCYTKLLRIDEVESLANR